MKKWRSTHRDELELHDGHITIHDYDGRPSVSYYFTDDEQAIALAVALIQATPGEHISVCPDPRIPGYIDIGRISLPREDAVYYALAIIRAAARKETP